jgi:hypothetical protein
MMNWALRLIDSDHRTTFLPDPFTGSPADAFARAAIDVKAYSFCQRRQCRVQKRRPSGFSFYRDSDQRTG